MTDVYSDEYWQTQFAVTQDDLKRIVERMEREQSPQSLKSIALRIIRGRLEHGHDLSPAALSRITGKSSVSLWDPEDDWQIGSLVLVARCRRENSPYEAFLGEIISLDPEHATIKIEELSLTTKYARLLPGTQNTKKYKGSAAAWRNTVLESVEGKVRSGNFMQQADGILLKHGVRILNVLHENLKADPRLIGMEGKWYLVSKLPSFEVGILSGVHQALLPKTDFTLDDLISLMATDSAANEILLKMSIQVALSQLPGRFEKISEYGRPQWRALPPKPEQAKVLYYAYDPQTYEVLCRPAEYLSEEVASRLDELEIYNHVVVFKEGI